MNPEQLKQEARRLTILRNVTGLSFDRSNSGKFRAVEWLRKGDDPRYSLSLAVVEPNKFAMFDPFADSLTPPVDINPRTDESFAQFAVRFHKCIIGALEEMRLTCPDLAAPVDDRACWELCLRAEQYGVDSRLFIRNEVTLEEIDVPGIMAVRAETGVDKITDLEIDASARSASVTVQDGATVTVEIFDHDGGSEAVRLTGLEIDYATETEGQDNE